VSYPAPSSTALSILLNLTQLNCGVNKPKSEANPPCANKRLLSKTNMGTREASHAGSWYENDPAGLSQQLDDFLGCVPDILDNSSLPIPSARVIIAP